ncbi:MAG: DUF397 domain-containing protein [Gemmatimonadaceae bacterium]
MSREIRYRKSSFSAQGDQCVEVADLPGGNRCVRDSKNPRGPELAFTPGEWDAFVKGVKAGEFD